MKKTRIKNYEIIPGRGLVTKSAIGLRLDYFKKNGFELDDISRYFLDHTSVQNNIESFIGTVEIPIGIVGPLLYCEKGINEFVYSGAGTLEGALVASMNRGAKAISFSGGFTATIVHQRMVRAPLFMLANSIDANIFQKWLATKFDAIKDIAEKFSNHAKLQDISAILIDNNVHVKFAYTTGDAAGQNMTTTCTWHSMLWIVENFLIETGIEIPHFVIEGNGSSDKKVSKYLVDHGRGIHVIAECFLEEDVIKKVLRTSSEDIYRCYIPSLAMTQMDGMLGFNINVANAVAAIFVATGQDLASIHESGIGILNVRKTENGLALKLTLPSVVIGTIGGGTALPDQNEGLKIMDCSGNGKIERFAKLIAGFALSLEISTYSAIVSGEFAKAHEKLGRNKPVNWLLKNELKPSFLIECLKGSFHDDSITTIEIQNGLIENGILTNITQRVNKKLTGFIPITIFFSSGQKENLLIKSKALDIDVIKGLHLMAASIDPSLSDLIYKSRKNLEYSNCHLKELSIYKCLSDNGFKNMPRYYGKHINTSREIYLLFQERLNIDELQLLDSENSPDKWTLTLIQNTIRSINQLHTFFSNAEIQKTLPEVKRFEPCKSMAFYKKMISIICQEDNRKEYVYLNQYIDDLENENATLNFPVTIIHNDFNPRNVAIRKDGTACIYDWELAVINIPHRDIIEFLSFVLPSDFKEEIFIGHLKFYYQLVQKEHPTISEEDWRKGYIYALKEFLVTRATFYKVSEILMKLKFADRIMLNAIRMISILSKSK